MMPEIRLLLVDDHESDRDLASLVLSGEFDRVDIEAHLQTGAQVVDDVVELARAGVGDRPVTVAAEVGADVPAVGTEAIIREHKLRHTFPKKVLDEVWTEDHIKSFLNVRPHDGTDEDFHMLLKAYQSMRERVGDAVVGVDIDKDRVDGLRAAGNNVVRGSVTDPDFWERLRRTGAGDVQVVMLAMPEQFRHTPSALRAYGDSQDWPYFATRVARG